jgi:ribosomal protein S3
MKGFQVCYKRKADTIIGENGSEVARLSAEIQKKFLADYK